MVCLTPFNTTILVADDEPHIRELVGLYLRNEGFEPVEASTGPEALALWQQRCPALVILDVMLPELDGWEVLKRIRREGNTPVVMLTARGEEIDRVLGLEMGADDYVVKPFSPRELVSRVKAVLRRSRRESLSDRETDVSGTETYSERAGEDRPGEPEVLSYPGLEVNRASREVVVRGQVLTLPLKEFELLWLLCLHPNRVFTREFLLETVWHYDYPGDVRTVDVHIRRLRQKVEEDPDEPRYLKTVRGVGYKFEYRSQSDRT